MPPLEQSFTDLEIGSKQPETLSSSVPFSLFSPQPKPSKFGITVGSYSDASELPGLALSPGSPEQRRKRINSCITRHNKKKENRTVKFSSSIRVHLIPSSHQKERTVKFSPSVRVRLIPSQKDISKEQKQSVWYSSEEAKKIRDKAIKVVEKLTNNKPLGKNETSRGLETKTPKEHRIRRRRIRRSILTVLKAQDKPYSQVLATRRRLLEQYQAFSSLDTWDDDEYLASLYRYNSRGSVKEAIDIAAIDEEEVRLFDMEDI